MSLVAQGLYPETLPPCFASDDSSRAFHGIIGELDRTKFRNRHSQYTRYNGTKHDGSRRSFGTPNIISYFHISTFIHKNWTDFENRFKESPYSLSVPNINPDESDRSIKVPSLSELSQSSSKNLGYAPVILKTDIAQFFSSIYTHSISWSKHGIAASKSDRSEKSELVYFNSLDFYTRNCQSGQTRGVIIGPDAFRLIAEFISSGIDVELRDAVGSIIVGAVRHVDDYYIGLKSESDALVVLSKLRDILARYELNINDSKTRIYSSLEPINDLWAQEIRKILSELHQWNLRPEKLEYVLDSAIDRARLIKSDSPVKMVIRGLDQIEIYNGINWSFAEKYLQRLTHYHPHAIDYICLLVAKRIAIGGEVDIDGWRSVSYHLIEKHVAFNNHHEIIWLFWMMLCCKIEIKESLTSSLSRMDNAHIGALLVQAYVDGRIEKRPQIRFASKLPSSDANWLLNLVARSNGFTSASFGGEMAAEFEHLASRKINLINIDHHASLLAGPQTKAISRTRYGYDDDDEADDDDFDIPI